MKSYIVTGLQFGDEGKGTTVDFLTKKYLVENKTLNVKFNGTSQAAHNVITDDNKHFCFSALGSGSFHGAKTLLTKDFIVNPTAILKETKAFNSVSGCRNILTSLYIDQRARVITPYHIAYNKLKCISQGVSNSCGAGLSAVMQEWENRPDQCILVQDLISDSICLSEKLDETKQYFFQELNKLKIDFGSPEVQEILGYFYYGEQTFRDDAFYLTENSLVRGANICDEEAINNLLNKTEVAIFEGCQGALLDQDSGIGADVTWSKTTNHNAINFLKEFSQYKDVTKIGVIRPYMIRHGWGVLSSETEIFKIKEKHNIMGRFQGGVRFGWLDLPLLKYAIDINDGIDYLALTHYDDLETRENWLVSFEYSPCAKPLVNFNNYHKQAHYYNPFELWKNRYQEVSSADIPARIEKYAKMPIKIVSVGPKTSEKYEK